jgi:Arc/MetJ-type ribon-helix-helix transcriptional regulator
MVKGFKAISIREELVQKIEKIIKEHRTYRSVADFVSEAIRLRLEALGVTETEKEEDA